MKLAALLVLVFALALAAPTASAKLTIPGVCVGYEDCYQKAHDGFAFFCVQRSDGWWMCMECESCGNPWIQLDAAPRNVDALLVHVALVP